MNRRQTIEILAVLKAAYPGSFNNMSEIDNRAMVALWERQFADEDARTVTAAVESLISTRTVGYTPTIGEIKEQIYRLRSVDELDAGSAWALVSKACRNGLYGYQKEYDKLPPVVQAAVGAPEQLRAWAMLDEETVQSVIASNFQKAYRATQKRQKDTAMLPLEVRKMISGISEKLSLSEAGRNRGEQYDCFDNL